MNTSDKNHLTLIYIEEDKKKTKLLLLQSEATRANAKKSPKSHQSIYSIGPRELNLVFSFVILVSWGGG